MKRLEATRPEAIDGGLSVAAAVQPMNGTVSPALPGADAAAGAPDVALHAQPSEPSWAAGAAAGQQGNAPPVKDEHTLASQALHPAEVVSSPDSTLPTEVIPSLDDTPATEIQQPGRSGSDDALDATVSDSLAADVAAAARAGGPSNAAVSSAAQGHSPHLSPRVEPAVAACHSKPPTCGTAETATEARQEPSAASPASFAQCSPEPTHEAALGQDPGQGLGYSTIEEAHLPLQLAMGSQDDILNVTSPTRSHTAGGGLDPALVLEATSRQVTPAEGDRTEFCCSKCISLVPSTHMCVLSRLWFAKYELSER